MQYLYFNIGYAILGLAISRVADKSYTQMVEERILKPLHMNDTYFDLPKEKFSRLAEGMDNEREGLLNTDLPLFEIKGRGYRVPNGGLFSTPRDLSKFVLSLMGKPNIITEKSLREMQNIPLASSRYGLGLMIIKNKVFNVVGHNGSVPGYTSQFNIEQDSGYAVILMRNYNKGNTNLERASLDLLKDLKQAE